MEWQKKSRWFAYHFTDESLDRLCLLPDIGFILTVIYHDSESFTLLHKTSLENYGNFLAVSRQQNYAFLTSF